MKTYRHTDAYEAATLLVATLLYELPTTRTVSEWIDTIANVYGLFHSQCMAKRVGAVALPGRIRAQARVLLSDVLGLDYLSSFPRLAVIAMIENALADLVGASRQVRADVMLYQKMLSDALLEQVLNDAPGFDFDFEPTTGVIGSGAYYHELNQQ